MRSETKKIIISIVYILSLVGFWGYSLFPSEEIINNICCNINRMMPEVSLSVGKGELTLPFGWAMKNMVISFQNKEAGSIKRALILPKIMPYFSGRTRQSLSTRLILSDLSVDLPVPVIRTLELKHIEMDIMWIGKQLNITGCTFNGNPIDGSLSGTIQIKDSFEKSQLQISGAIRLKPDMMIRLKQSSMGLLFSQNRKTDSNEFPFQITGTVDAPLLSLP